MDFPTRNLLQSTLRHNHLTIAWRDRMSYWQGKTAVITGASAGLGLTIVKALAQAKANVCAVARGKDCSIDGETPAHMTEV